jgi:hypothetical protein
MNTLEHTSPYYWWMVTGAFSLCYTVGSYAIKAGIDCPKTLDPKNNNGKKSKDYHDYYGNYTSIIHAVLGFFLSMGIIFTEGATFGEPTSNQCHFVLAHSMGYFIFDSIQSEYHKYNALAMTFHHIGALLIFGFALLAQKYGNECIVIIAIGEVSNPFNLYREILKWYKEENTDKYHFTSVIFAIIFILARFVVGVFWIANFYISKTDFPFKLCSTLLWYVSWHWLFIIINMATKEFKQRATKTAGKSNFWEDAYAVFFKLRKSKMFSISYYLITAFITFGLLVIVHPW